MILYGSLKHPKYCKQVVLARIVKKETDSLRFDDKHPRLERLSHRDPETVQEMAAYTANNCYRSKGSLLPDITTWKTYFIDFLCTNHCKRVPLHIVSDRKVSKIPGIFLENCLEMNTHVKIYVIHMNELRVVRNLPF